MVPAAERRVRLLAGPALRPRRPAGSRGTAGPRGLQQPVMMAGDTESCQKTRSGCWHGRNTEGRARGCGGEWEHMPGFQTRLCWTRLGRLGLVKGNLFLQRGPCSSWVPGQGPSFANRPNASQSLPSASGSGSPSISSSVFVKPAKVSFNPYFRRFLGCPHC